MSWMWATPAGGSNSCSVNSGGQSAGTSSASGAPRSRDFGKKRRGSGHHHHHSGQRSPEPRLQLNNVMVDPIFDYQFRVILIGDSAVGKSSLLRKFTFGSFAEVSDPTVGVDFFARLVRVDDGVTTIKLQLWDTAGQERFRSITKAYYRNSVGVLLVYDLCERVSFESVGQWMSEARRHIEPHQATFVLVGCKQDMATSRQVTMEEATAFAASHRMAYFETSAKHGEGVEAPFQHLAQVIYNKIKSGEYKFQDGWDGIKRSYFAHSRYHFHGSEEPAAAITSSANDSNITLAHGEPVGSRASCC